MKELPPQRHEQETAALDLEVLRQTVKEQEPLVQAIQLCHNNWHQLVDALVLLTKDEQLAQQPDKQRLLALVCYQVVASVQAFPRYSDIEQALLAVDLLITQLDATRATALLSFLAEKANAQVNPTEKLQSLILLASRNREIEGDNGRITRYCLSNLVATRQHTLDNLRTAYSLALDENLNSDDAIEIFVMWYFNTSIKDRSTLIATLNAILLTSKTERSLRLREKILSEYLDKDKAYQLSARRLIEMGKYEALWAAADAHSVRLTVDLVKKVIEALSVTQSTLRFATAAQFTQAVGCSPEQLIGYLTQYTWLTPDQLIEMTNFVPYESIKDRLPQPETIHPAFRLLLALRYDKVDWIQPDVLKQVDLYTMFDYLITATSNGQDRFAQKLIEHLLGLNPVILFATLKQDDLTADLQVQLRLHSMIVQAINDLYLPMPKRIECTRHAIAAQSCAVMYCQALQLHLLDNGEHETLETRLEAYQVLSSCSTFKPIDDFKQIVSADLEAARSVVTAQPRSWLIEYLPTRWQLDSSLPPDLSAESQVVSGDLTTFIESELPILCQTLDDASLHKLILSYFDHTIEAVSEVHKTGMAQSNRIEYVKVLGIVISHHRLPLAEKLWIQASPLSSEHRLSLAEQLISQGEMVYALKHLKRLPADHLAHLQQTALHTAVEQLVSKHDPIEVAAYLRLVSKVESPRVLVQELFRRLPIQLVDQVDTSSIPPDFLIQVIEVGSQLNHPSVNRMLDGLYCEPEELMLRPEFSGLSADELKPYLLSQPLQRVALFYKKFVGQTQSLLKQYATSTSTKDHLRRDRVLTEYRAQPRLWCEQLNQLSDQQLIELFASFGLASMEIDDAIKSVEQLSGAEELSKRLNKVKDTLVYWQIRDQVGQALSPELKDLWLNTNINWAALITKWRRLHPSQQTFLIRNLCKLNELNHIQPGLAEKLLKSRYTTDTEHKLTLGYYYEQKVSLSHIAGFARYPLGMLLDQANLSIQDTEHGPRLIYDLAKKKRQGILLAVTTDDYNGALTDRKATDDTDGDLSPTVTMEPVFADIRQQAAQHNQVCRIMEVGSPLKALQFLYEYPRRFSGKIAGVIFFDHGLVDSISFNNQYKHSLTKLQMQTLGIELPLKQPDEPISQFHARFVMQPWNSEQQHAILSIAAELHEPALSKKTFYTIRTLNNIYKKLSELCLPSMPSLFVSCLAGTPGGLVEEYSKAVKGVAYGTDISTNIDSIRLGYSESGQLLLMAPQFVDKDTGGSKGTDHTHAYYNGVEQPQLVGDNRKLLFQSLEPLARSELVTALLRSVGIV